MTLRVYFDTDVTSALSKRDLKPAEMNALDELRALKEKGAINIDTSLHTHIEIERAPAEHQPKLKEPLAELGRVEKDREVKGFAAVRDLYGGQSAMPLVSDIVDRDLYDHLLARRVSMTLRHRPNRNLV